MPKGWKWPLLPKKLWASHGDNLLRKTSRRAVRKPSKGLDFSHPRDPRRQLKRSPSPLVLQNILPFCLPCTIRALKK
eukprot:1144125-Pelagomonas_calceolata.AAC.4